MDLRFVIGLIGSVVLVLGVATANRRKNTLFALGNACMFTYALLGYLQGGSIFFLILQMYIALSTIFMLLKVPDTYDTPLLALAGIGLIAWSLSLFQGYSTAIFVLGLVFLGLGFAMDMGTIRREAALMIGSAVIAVFSFLLRDWIFVALNVLFAAFSLLNIVHLKAGKR